LLDDHLVPRLQVYSKESTIAEKFQSLVRLNILTSRMKDIYDILFLASQRTSGLAFAAPDSKLFKWVRAFK